MKKAFFAILALMLIVCLASCGGDAKEIGSYDLESMTEDGTTMTLKELKDMYDAYGVAFPEFSLVLNKDGTGKMTVAGETQNINWDAKAKTMSHDNETINYTFKDNKITLSEDGTSLVFVKKN